MNEDFSSAAEFYALRDNRTNQCPGAVGYESRRVLITTAPGVAASIAGQVALYGLTCQLARWCRSVAVEVPLCPTLLPGVPEPEFPTALLGAMADADPYGTFATDIQYSGQADIQLHLGAGPVVVRATNFLRVTWAGWSCRVASDDSAPLVSGGDRNDIPGAAAASCIGCACAFQFAVGVVPTPCTDFSLWDHSSSLEPGRPLFQALEPLAIGELLLVGAGSVGTAAAFWMRLFDLSGRMDVVDHDIVKIENINRGLLFGVSNRRENKARIIEKHFRSSPLEIRGYDTDWEGYTQSTRRAAMPRDIWLPLANERNVRSTMGESIPPAMIQASTSRNWGANFGRHIPLRDDCILDRFPPAEAQPILVCSTGKVQTRAVEVDAALPFLSAFAGLLVAADVLRSTASDYPQAPNFGVFDFHSGLIAQAWDRGPRASCPCVALRPELWMQFNEHSRLAHQSLESSVA